MRWLRTAAAATGWGFVAVGVLGLAEATWHAWRHGVPLPPPPLGTVGSLLGAFTLTGWFGLLASLAALPPLALLLGRRADGHARTLAGAVGLAIGLLVAVFAGAWLHDAAAALWWREQVGTLWLPRLALAGVVGLLVALGLRRPLAALLAGPSVRVLAPWVVVIAVTALWPDWRGMAREHQVGALDRREATADAPNVVLLSIDTLRRDKLSCLDDQAPATPRLDALAADSYLFGNAWSVSSWTLPAMATVFTGEAPRALGVDAGAGLPAAAPTLPELAWRAGWDTAAVVANPWLMPEYGFSRGFAHFDHTDIVEPLMPAASSALTREITRYVIGTTEPADGQRIVAAARRWLAARQTDRPFLLWLHFMDPHLPYRSHPDDPHGPAPVPSHPLFADDRFMNLAPLRDLLPDVPEVVRRGVEALYDSEVRHADRCVGELLDALASAGELDDSWIVLLSDHGEEFFEHGGYEHGHSLMPEVTGVPLLIRPPGGLDSGVRDDRAVTLLDLLPSLGETLGWPLPAPLPGRPALVPDASGAFADPTPLTVLENMLYGPPEQATLSWPDLRVMEPESGLDAWFDLARDPTASSARPAPADADSIAAARRDLIARWNDRHAELVNEGDANSQLSEAAQRRLRSLGY